MNALGAMGTARELFSGTELSERCGTKRWILLYGKHTRPIMLPEGKIHVQQECLRMFRNSLSALPAELALRLSHILPGLVTLRPFHAPPIEKSEWIKSSGLEGVSDAAIQIGTPGPHQKATVLLLDRFGSAIGLAKVGIGAKADEMVEREAEWLLMLSQYSTLTGRIPKIISHGTTDMGRRYLITNLIQGTYCRGRFSEDEHEFLGSLASCDPISGPYVESSAHQRLLARYEILQNRISKVLARILREAILECELALKDWSGPLVISHGDFVPWNLRRTDTGLCAFDWEYAQREAIPPHDELHWNFLRRALGIRRIDQRFINRVRNQVSEDLASTFPNDDWSALHIDGFVLHYLLDIILFYSSVDGSVNVRHPVVGEYLRIIEARSKWMR